MPTPFLERIATTRFLVGSLGERKNWWPSRFTDQAAQRSLEMVFPRTWTRAALESVVEVARRDHDQLVARQDFHLFRLPPYLEDRLAAWLSDPALSLEWPPQEAVEIAALLEPGPLTGASGLVCLGHPKRLQSEATFQEVAGIYARAAQEDLRVVPYFEGDR